MQRRIALLLVALSILFPLFGCRQASIAENTTATTFQTQPTQTETPTTTVTETTSPTESETTQPVNETQPAEPVDLSAAWTPLCEEFIYLRDTADKSQILSRIPVGALLTLDAWQGKYALVTYQGTQGYVTANFIQPADDAYFTARLQTVSLSETYSHTQMLADMQTLQKKYPAQVQLSSIGKSAEGRDIPVMRIGNPDAQHHVLMQGAMHGREHFTACLLMAIADISLSQNLFASNDVCYHIIPMTNPDGVFISQSQTLNSNQTEIYQNDVSCGYTEYTAKTYAQKWKANALGVDLNRNFPSGWEESLERPLPSSERFRGDSPLCAPESSALADYTKAYDFHATLSFHSHGSVLYYCYGTKEPVNTLSYRLATAVSKTTGYQPIRYDGTTGAGYKDWAMDALKIPSITVEIGSSQTPLAQRDMYNTFARFENFIPTMNQWLTDTF